jgi:hypothetical protein
VSDQPAVSTAWAPVDIPPHGPGVYPARLHHRHNGGFGCGACEIVRLRAAVERLTDENSELRRTLGSHPLFDEKNRALIAAADAMKKADDLFWQEESPSQTLREAEEEARREAAR